MTNAEKYEEIFAMPPNTNSCPTSDCIVCPCAKRNPVNELCIAGSTYEWWCAEYTGDKEERPQGEWLPLSDISPSGFGTWVCSQCGHGFRGIKSKMPYCTCGAKMSNGGADMRGKE